MKWAAGWWAALACLAMAALCFLAVPLLMERARGVYRQREALFDCPVPLPPGGARLRHDVYGKGYFGAPRNRGRKHRGVDLLVGINEPIYASKSGRVSTSGFDERGYGYYVQLTHLDGFTTRYAHLSQNTVYKGEWVAQGSIVGKSGKSGNAADPKIKPHLHFEIRKDDKAINPQRGILRGIAS